MKNTTSKLGIVLLFMALSLAVKGQDAAGSTTNDASERGPSKNRYVLAWQPGKAKNIYGIALGFVGQDVVCNAPYHQKTFGVNAQLGGGLYHWKQLTRSEYNSRVAGPGYQESAGFKSMTNGLQISLFGTQTAVVHGIAASFLVSTGEQVDGAAINLGASVYSRLNGISVSFRNDSFRVRGLQLGVTNHANRMRGIQLGIWNRTLEPNGVLQIGIFNNLGPERRTWPLLNFGGFAKKNTSNNE